MELKSTNINDGRTGRIFIFGRKGERIPCARFKVEGLSVKTQFGCETRGEFTASKFSMTSTLIVRAKLEAAKLWGVFANEILVSFDDDEN